VLGRGTPDRGAPWARASTEHPIALHHRADVPQPARAWAVLCHRRSVARAQCYRTSAKSCSAHSSRQAGPSAYARTTHHGARHSPHTASRVFARGWRWRSSASSCPERTLQRLPSVTSVVPREQLPYFEISRPTPALCVRAMKPPPLRCQ